MNFNNIIPKIRIIRLKLVHNYIIILKYRVKIRTPGWYSLHGFAYGVTELVLHILHRSHFSLVSKVEPFSSIFFYIQRYG